MGKKIEIKCCYLQVKLDSSLGPKTPQEAFLDYLLTRENDGTERDAQGVGRDVLCSRKICLTQWRSRFSGGSLFSETSAAVLPRSKVLKDTLSAIT